MIMNNKMVIQIFYAADLGILFIPVRLYNRYHMMTAPIILSVKQDLTKGVIKVILLDFDGTLRCENSPDDFVILEIERSVVSDFYDEVGI